MPTIGFEFKCHGARVRLRASSISLLAAMHDRLPPASKVINSEGPASLFSIIARNCLYRLYGGSQLLMETDSRDSALSELESQLHGAIAFNSSPGLFVHAGVVGWKQGAIVIPGRSGSGKSTLVAALVSAGAAEYYSDEYAIFDQAGYVHPYPKLLSLREPFEGHTGKCSAAELGGRVGTEPIPVRLVVATHYDEHGYWQPQILSPSQTVLRLFENTIHARKRAHYAMDIFARVAATSVAVGGARPTWDRVLPSLLALCEESANLPMVRC